MANEPEGRRWTDDEKSVVFKRLQNIELNVMRICEYDDIRSIKISLDRIIADNTKLRLLYGMNEKIEVIKNHMLENMNQISHSPIVATYEILDEVRRNLKTMEERKISMEKKFFYLQSAIFLCLLYISYNLFLQP